MRYKFEIELSSVWTVFNPLYEGTSIERVIEEKFLADRKKLPTKLVFLGDDYDLIKAELDAGSDRLECRLSEDNGTAFEVIAAGYLSINQDSADYITQSKRVTLKVVTVDEYTELEDILDNEIDLYGFTTYLTRNLSYYAESQLEFQFSDEGAKWKIVGTYKSRDLYARVYVAGNYFSTDYIYDAGENKSFAEWDIVYPLLASNLKVRTYTASAPDDYTLVFNDAEEALRVFVLSSYWDVVYSVTKTVAGAYTLRAFLEEYITAETSILFDSNSFAFCDNVLINELILTHNEASKFQFQANRKLKLSDIFKELLRENVYWWLEEITGNYYFRLDQKTNRYDGTGVDFTTEFSGRYNRNITDYKIEDVNKPSIIRRTEKLQPLKRTDKNEDFKGLDITFPSITKELVLPVNWDFIYNIETLQDEDFDGFSFIKATYDEVFYVLIKMANGDDDIGRFLAYEIDGGGSVAFDEDEILALNSTSIYKFYTAPALEGLMETSTMPLSNKIRIEIPSLTAIDADISVDLFIDELVDGEFITRSINILTQSAGGGVSGVDLTENITNALAYGRVRVTATATTSGAGYVQLQGFKLSYDRYEVDLDTGALSGVSVQNAALSQANVDANFIYDMPLKDAYVNGVLSTVPRIADRIHGTIAYPIRPTFNDFDGFGVHTTLLGSTILRNIKRDLAENIDYIELALHEVPYVITFNVKDSDGANVENASIEVNSETKLTDSSGNAEFDLNEGTYPYEITKSGFKTISDSVIVTEDDTVNNVVYSDTSKYGYLYNWYAANLTDFAPTDWALPSESNFITLYNYLGGNSVAGGPLKDNSGYTYWNSPNTAATNSSGFTGYGAGTRANFFSALKTNAYFWNTKINLPISGGIFTLYYNTDNAYIGSTSVFVGNSVRLIYTGTGTAPAQITDEDGNIYDTIVIGTQTWLVQNWACTKLNDGTPLTKVTDQTEWSALTTEAYCAYDNNESNVFI